MTSHTSYDAAHAAARRAVARQLHPDLGGDVHKYLAAMEQVDRQFGVAVTPGAPGTPAATPPVLHRRFRLSGVRGETRLAVRTVRAALPRRWPGSRRYGQL